MFNRSGLANRFSRVRGGEQIDAQELKESSNVKHVRIFPWFGDYGYDAASGRIEQIITGEIGCEQAMLMFQSKTDMQDEGKWLSLSNLTCKSFSRTINLSTHSSCFVLQDHVTKSFPFELITTALVSRMRDSLLCEQTYRLFDYDQKCPIRHFLASNCTCNHFNKAK